MQISLVPQTHPDFFSGCLVSGRGADAFTHIMASHFTTHLTLMVSKYWIMAIFICNQLMAHHTSSWGSSHWIITTQANQILIQSQQGLFEI